MWQFSFFRTLIGFLLIFSLIAYLGNLQTQETNLPSHWNLTNYQMLVEQSRPALLEEREDEDWRQKKRRKGELNFKPLFPNLSASSPLSLKVDFGNGRDQRR